MVVAANLDLLVFEIHMRYQSEQFLFSSLNSYLNSAELFGEIGTLRRKFTINDRLEGSWQGAIKVDTLGELELEVGRCFRRSKQADLLLGDVLLVEVVELDCELEAVSEGSVEVLVLFQAEVVVLGWLEREQEKDVEVAAY